MSFQSSGIPRALSPVQCFAMSSTCSWSYGNTVVTACNLSLGSCLSSHMSERKRLPWTFKTLRSSIAISYLPSISTWRLVSGFSESKKVSNPFANSLVVFSCRMTKVCSRNLLFDLGLPGPDPRSRGKVACNPTHDSRVSMPKLLKSMTGSTEAVVRTLTSRPINDRDSSRSGGLDEKGAFRPSNFRFIDSAKVPVMSERAVSSLSKWPSFAYFKARSDSVPICRWRRLLWFFATKSNGQSPWASSSGIHNVDRPSISNFTRSAFSHDPLYCLKLRVRIEAPWCLSKRERVSVSSEQACSHLKRTKTIIRLLWKAHVSEKLRLPTRKCAIAAAKASRWAHRSKHSKHWKPACLGDIFWMPHPHHPLRYLSLPLLHLWDRLHSPHRRSRGRCLRSRTRHPPANIVSWQFLGIWYTWSLPMKMLEGFLAKGDDPISMEPSTRQCGRVQGEQSHSRSCTYNRGGWGREIEQARAIH